MIAFELFMPNKGSWDEKWSQEDECFIRTMDQWKVPKEYWGKDFYYNFGDGWGACVSVRKCTISEARKLKRKSKGFCGYDWMIASIIKYGEIKYGG